LVDIVATLKESVDPEREQLPNHADVAALGTDAFQLSAAQKARFGPIRRLISVDASIATHRRNSTVCSPNSILRPGSESRSQGPGLFCAKTH